MKTGERKDEGKEMRNGKILRVKLGFNPNSSSLGSDVSLLLMGATAITFLVNLADVGLRLWLKRSREKSRGAGRAG